MLDQHGHSRRRLHLADPSHGAGEIDEGFERADGFLAAQGNPAEAFDTIEETLDQMPLFVEGPVDVSVFAAGRVALDVGCRAEVIGDEAAQVIGVVGRVHDDVLRFCEPLDQAACLRAVAPLAGGDCEPDRQSEGVDGGVDFRGQAALGPANTGSFKPPF